MTAMLAWSQGQDLVAVKVAGISHSLHAARSLQPVPCWQDVLCRTAERADSEGSLAGGETQS